LKHDFVVLGFQSQAMAADAKGIYSAGPFEIKSSTDDAPGAVVAWVSKEDGSIVQIAGGWLPVANK